MKFFNVVSDFLSPTWWLNQVLKDTINCNPLEFATHHIIGDWEGFARCAMVWDDLGMVGYSRDAASARSLQLAASLSNKQLSRRFIL